MHKVLIPTKLDKAAAALLSERGYEVVLDGATPLADLVAANSDAEVLIVRSEKITAETIDQLPELKLVVRAGAGFNTIDTKYAREKNIDVMNTPGANSNAVAEEVVAMMLAGSRFLIPADAST
ncbi:MAG: 3-phosphoglycerate dehydrogenase, partial [Lentisphaeria bacterium]|nr:3-phosphoglycerate dehydrogenase [Lentisphaeria bacterium]